MCFSGSNPHRFAPAYQTPDTEDEWDDAGTATSLRSAAGMWRGRERLSDTVRLCSLIGKLQFDDVVCRAGNCHVVQHDVSVGNRLIVAYSGDARDAENFHRPIQDTALVARMAIRHKRNHWRRWARGTRFVQAKVIEIDMAPAAAVFINKPNGNLLPGIYRPFGR